MLTYDDLQAKLLTITEERDSLLTTLKLLARESTSVPTTSHSGDYKNGKDGQSNIIKGKGKGKDKGKASKSTKGNVDHPKVDNSKLPTSNGTSGSEEHKNKLSQQNHVDNGCDVVVIGDSITKHIHGHRLSRKHKVKNMSFPGATVEDMADFVKPIIRKSRRK